MDNLISLPFLNEPELLNGFKTRFMKNMIYTYTGPVLVTFNPSNLHSKSFDESLFADFIRNIKANIKSGLGSKSLDPSDPSSLDTTLSPDILKYSIMISGESGSGKTECAKKILNYLIDNVQIKRGNNTHTSPSKVPNNAAIAYGLTNITSSETQKQQETIITNVIRAGAILESFGNSMLPHSGNSSRYGSYISLEFNDDGELIDSRIRTYLLENIRVVHQLKGERNFHLFYQILAGATQEQKESWKLSSSIEDYDCLNGWIASPEVTTKDKAGFEQLKEDMQALGIDTNQIELVFKTMAGLLHFGNIKFESNYHDAVEGTNIDPTSREKVELAAELLSFPVDVMEHCLTKRSMTSRGELFLLELKPVQAMHARDAIAKAVYRKVFDWITHEVNLQLSKTRPVDQKTVSMIGILDIFGFDAFEVNTFEQLCINYTNEALQQVFNQQTFKLVMQEYAKEQINFESIEFVDNQDSLDLIGTQLFTILDDQCKIPNASDKRFAAQIYKEFERHPKFTATPAHKAVNTFCIVHYAGPVDYTTDGVVERNIDELPVDAKKLLSTTPNTCINYLKTHDANLTSPIKSNARRANSIISAPTAVTQYRNELNTLIAYISSTTAQFIRCINPISRNAKVASNETDFHPKHVAAQIQYSGILEVIRISRSGYPIRYKFSEFIQRYLLIISHTSRTTSSFITEFKHKVYALAKNSFVDFAAWKELTQEFLNKLLELSLLPMDPKSLSLLSPYTLTKTLNNANIQVGLSKVFIRKQEFEYLEYARNKKLAFIYAQLENVIHSYMLTKNTRLKKKKTAVLHKNIRTYLFRMSINKRIENKKIAASTPELTTVKSDNDMLAEHSPVKLTPQVSFAKTESSSSVIFPPDIEQFSKIAKLSREKRNLYGKVLEYKRLDSKLLQEINSLIAAKRIADESILLRFNITNAKKLLLEWSYYFEGILKSKTLDISAALDFGYRLLAPEKLVPQSALNRAFSFARSTEAKAKHANKNITKEHKVFKQIFKLLDRLKELIETAETEKIYLEDRMKKYPKLTSPSTTNKLLNASKLIDFCRILYEYYYQYILNIVKEYGDFSTFKESFADETAYLLALVKLMEEKKPMLVAEMVASDSVLSPGSSDNFGLFPLTLSMDSIAQQTPGIELPNSGNDNSSDKVVFKLIKCAPGIEYSVNCLMHLLSGEILMYPVRLIKLVGKSATNYGQTAYYHASMNFSEDTLYTGLKDLLIQPALKVSLDQYSYSVAFLVLLLTNAKVCRGEHLMVRKVQQSNGEVLLKIVGFNNDETFCDGLFSFASSSLFSSPNIFQELAEEDDEDIENILFTLPQFQNLLHPDVVHMFLNNNGLVEEIISAWFRELYLQNKRYESLMSSGFTQKDLLALNVPIYLPANSMVNKIYTRFQRIRSFVVDHPTSTTHADLLRLLAPSVLHNYPSSVENYSYCLTVMNQYTSATSFSNTTSNNKEATAHNNNNQNMGEHGLSKRKWDHKYICKVDESAKELIQHIDFRPLSIIPSTWNFDQDPSTWETSSTNASTMFTSGSITDNLSFLTSLYLVRVTETQLIVMFGGLIESSFRSIHKHAQAGSAGHKSHFASKIFTRYIYLIGLTEAEQESLKQTNIYKRIESLLEIQMLFVANVSSLPKTLSAYANERTSFAFEQQHRIEEYELEERLSFYQEFAMLKLNQLQSQGEDIDEMKRIFNKQYKKYFLLLLNYITSQLGTISTVAVTSNPDSGSSSPKSGVSSTNNSQNPALAAKKEQIIYELQIILELMKYLYPKPGNSSSSSPTHAQQQQQANNSSQSSLINYEYVNYFLKLFLAHPDLFMELAIQLAKQGIFNHCYYFLHELLIQSSLERFFPFIILLIQQSPILIMIPNISDHYYPADRLKFNIRVRLENNYYLLSRILNASVWFYTIKPLFLWANTLQSKDNIVSSNDILSYDHLVSEFFSTYIPSSSTSLTQSLLPMIDQYFVTLPLYQQYEENISILEKNNILISFPKEIMKVFTNNEEELIYLGVRYGLFVTIEDLLTKQFNFMKRTETSFGALNLLQCIYFIATEYPQANELPSTYLTGSSPFSPAAVASSTASSASSGRSMLSKFHHLHQENYYVLLKVMAVLRERIKAQTMTKEQILLLLSHPKIDITNISTKNNYFYREIQQLLA